MEEEETVYMAVGRGEREARANLQWALRNAIRRRKLVLLHVHRPAARINMMGAWVPVSQLAEEEVAAYRRLETEKINQVLDDLLHVCTAQKVNAGKIVIESDDTAGGLVEFIGGHGVAELVMGAASDRRYSRKMRAPRSKKAVTVQRMADPSCKIWFVCRGNLVCTREAGEGSTNAGSSATSCTSPGSSTSESSRSKSSRQPPSLDCSPDPVEWTTYRWAELPPQAGIAGPSTIPSDMEIKEELANEDNQMPYQYSSDDAAIDDELYEKLKGAIMDAENLKREAYEESRWRQKAEQDLAEASRRAKCAESAHVRAAKHRQEADEQLARERAELEQDELELHRILNEIKNTGEQSAALELQIADSERAAAALEAKLSESCRLLDTFRPDRRQSPCGLHDDRFSFTEFTAAELMEATDDFDVGVKIGGGNYGIVYRGFLRGTPVAVKVLHPEVTSDELEFSRQVEALSRVRHPNLATVVGACAEARAIVYEFMPNGSLEDHLRGTAPALPWHVRAGIAYETCCALLFLHSGEPRPLMHGDLKPENVLLGEDFSCKLADFGMRGLLDRSRDATAALCRRARGALAYVDPHYLATGELTPQCDAYALGVLLLRLLTGMPAFRARKAVQEAVDDGRLHEVLDPSAGGWPPELAGEVALLGLRCCDGTRGRGPELVEEARRVLEPVVSTAPCRVSSFRSVGSDGEGSGGVPSYFLCPIFKEIMRDPQIAADGFTYDADAIRGWLDGGHDTSPMTNLKLPCCELIPNRNLRSAIQEWLQKRQNLLKGCTWRSLSNVGCA